MQVEESPSNRRKIVFQEKPSGPKSHFSMKRSVSNINDYESNTSKMQNATPPPRRQDSLADSPSKIKRRKSKNFLKNIAVLRKFFIKKTRVQPLVGEPTLTKEQIYKKFRRARTILRIIFTLNKISEEIIVYGTSSNLFDLSIRDRQALKRYLFPLLYQEQDDFFSDQVEFPLIHPNSIIKIIWNPILFFLMVYTATLLPYRMAFEPDLEDQGWFIFDIIIDILFWLDFIINFISAYYDDEGKLIKTRKEVMINYLKSWFLVDLVACLPMEEIFIAAIGSEGESDKIRLMKLAKLPKLMRLIRITKVVKFVRYYSKTDLLDVFEFNAGIVRLINLFFTVFLIVHLMSCLWNYIAILESDNPDNWVTRNNLEDVAPISKYIACVYFALAGLTTVGYGDIYAKTVAEMIVITIWMVIGVGFYSGAIGILTSVLQNMDQKSNTLSRKIAIMNEFCKEMKIKKELKDKMKRVLEYNANRNCFSWIDHNQLFADLPISLRNEIIFNIHEQVVLDLQFFKISEDKVFAVKIVPYLKALYLNETEYIWMKGNTADGVYLLVSGRVVYLDEFEFERKKKLVGFKSMINGSYFGEIEILQKRKREYYVQCEQRCDMYLLERNIFESQVLKEFPIMQQRLKSISEERQRRNHAALNELQNIVDKINQEKKGNSDESEDNNDNEDNQKSGRESQKNSRHSSSRQSPSSSRQSIVKVPQDKNNNYQQQQKQYQQSQQKQDDKNQKQQDDEHENNIEKLKKQIDDIKNMIHQLQ